MENHEVEEHRLHWNRKVVQAYQNALAPLTRAATSLLGLWTIACVLGWKRADAYYSAFGADWITRNLSIFNFLSLSYWPIIALVAGVLITFTDLADRYDKSMKNVWRITAAALIITTCLALWANWQGDFEKSSFAYALLLFNVGLALGLRFGEQAMDLANKDFKWGSSNVWTFFFLCAWFLSIVSSLGSAEGKRDRHVEQTKLDIVETRSGEKFRLLLEKDGLIYGALLKANDSPRVRIIERQEILFIYRQPPKAKSEIKKTKAG